MPNEDVIQVKDRNGKVVPIFKKNLAEAIKRGGTPIGMQPPKQEEEGTLKKVAREIPLGMAAGAGIPETQTPVQDMLKGLKEQAAKMFVRPYTKPGVKSLKEMVEANPGIAIPKGLVDTAEETAKSAGVRNMNLGPGVDVPFLGGAADYPKFAHDISSLFTQLGLLKGGKEAAETPLAESPVVKGAKAIPEVPKTASRELLGIGEKSVEREKAAAEKLAQAEKETGRKKYAEDFAAKEKEKLEQSKAEGKKKSLEVLRDKRAKEVVQNLDKTDETIKTAFDSEYGDFDAKILGKSKANPKGTLQSDLSSFAKSVQNAETNIIEGSEESIKQFNQIMDRLGKDKLDTGKGLDIAPGQTISAVDLRGFVTELQKRIYDSELLPDVRRALKSVAEAGTKEVQNSVQRSFGDTAVAALKDLNKRYSQYLTDWKDSSSASPIPKIRQFLHEPIRKNTPGVPIQEKVAPLLEGTGGNIALPILAKYRKYGLNPEIIDSYRKAAQGASEAPKPKAVDPLERPKPSETKPFSAEEFRKEKIGKKADSLSNLSMWDIAAMSAGIEELLRGRPLIGASAVSIPIIKRLLARGLSKEGVIDWLSKEGPTP